MTFLKSSVEVYYFTSQSALDLEVFQKFGTDSYAFGTLALNCNSVFGLRPSSSLRSERFSGINQLTSRSAHLSTYFRCVKIIFRSRPLHFAKRTCFTTFQKILKYFQKSSSSLRKAPIFQHISDTFNNFQKSTSSLRKAHIFQHISDALKQFSKVDQFISQSAHVSE